MYACLYQPPAVDPDRRRTGGPGRAPDMEPAPDSAVSAFGVVDALVVIARQFSPRIQRHRDDLVTVDVSGLDRLIGSPRTIGEELRRTAAAQGQRVHVAVARTRSAALLLA